MGEVRIGTSGWSYPSGPGTWNGIFYPSREPPGRPAKADDLAYYAEHFDTVEVNSSFYRLPDPAVTRGWAARTPSRFDFCLKLFQKFTHPAMYLKGADVHAAGETNPIPAISGADVDAFRQSIEPIASAGKLGALLAQFPPTFRHGEDALGYLAWLMQAFSDYPVAIELRHRSWSDREQEVLGLLRAHGAAWVQIDEPKFRFSIRQDRLPDAGRLCYMRLHGRNAEQWWKHDHPDERYNYLYSAGRNRRLRRHGHPRASTRPEHLRLHEQPLRREGGGECGGPAPRRGPAGPGRVHGRDAGAVRVPQGYRGSTRIGLALRRPGR